MRYGSVCSGIEAASAAWESLGWQPVFFSEIEPFPSAVLQHHWPSVPNHGDMAEFESWGHQDIDVLVGGTPCQSFSIAGLRGGLKDARGNLSLTFARMVDKLRPQWCVWENVTGVLSTNGGRDFASIIGALDELGYAVGWRVLDAQNFGVPQRRRRVFVVGCASGFHGDTGSVLFESQSGCRNTEARRKEKQSTATGTVACFAGNVRTNVAATLQTTMHDYSRADGFNTVLHASKIAPAITSSGPPYSRTGNQRVECDALVVQPRVRRLTPVEAERLQGFRDNHTGIEWKGKQAPDSQRYKALGNSMAVPVMRWIGERIASQ